MTDEIKRFIEELDDDKLKKFLSKKYMSNNKRKKEIENEIFRAVNNISENRCNSSYYRKANKEWRERNGF